MGEMVGGWSRSSQAALRAFGRLLLVGSGCYQGVGEKGWATLGLLRALCPSQRAPGCGSRALRFHNADILPGQALSRGV